MGMIKLLFAPIRAIARFPLFQFAVVVAVILFLQAADENSALGQIFDGLDKLVDSTVTFLSAIITEKSFTKSWLTSGFMIAYVYLACLLIPVRCSRSDCICCRFDRAQQFIVAQKCYCARTWS